MHAGAPAFELGADRYEKNHLIASWAPAPRGYDAVRVASSMMTPRSPAFDVSFKGSEKSQREEDRNCRIPLHFEKELKGMLD